MIKEKIYTFNNKKEAEFFLSTMVEMKYIKWGYFYPIYKNKKEVKYFFSFKNLHLSELILSVEKLGFKNHIISELNPELSKIVYF